MHIVAGLSALKLIRAIRRGLYGGRIIALPTPELPEREVSLFTAGLDKPQRTVPLTADEWTAEMRRYAVARRIVGQDKPHKIQGPTLAESDFPVDDVYGNSRIDLSLFHGLDDLRVAGTLYLTILDKRRRMQTKRTHLCLLSPNIPAWLVIPINADLAVASPELAVAQAARELTDVQLAQHIMELCGTYALRPSMDGTVTSMGADSSAACVYNLQPVMTLEKLETCLQALRLPVTSRQTLTSAMDLAGEGAASPAEARLAIMLGAPLDTGGYGFGMPLLNARLVVPSGFKGHIVQNDFHLDLFWQSLLLDLEYESAAFHLDPSVDLPADAGDADAMSRWRLAHIERAAGDRIRLRRIQALGVQVMPVVPQDLYSIEALDEVAWAIACRREALGGQPAAAWFAGIDDYQARRTRGALLAQLATSDAHER